MTSFNRLSHYPEAFRARRLATHMNCLCGRLQDRILKSNELAVPAGFEPATSRFGGVHSIQLSYGTACNRLLPCTKTACNHIVFGEFLGIALWEKIFYIFYNVLQIHSCLRRAALYPAELWVHLGHRIAGTLRPRNRKFSRKARGPVPARRSARQPRRGCCTSRKTHDKWP